MKKGAYLWIFMLMVILFLGLRVYKLNYLVDTNGVDEGIQLMSGKSLRYGYELYSQINCVQAPLFIGLYGLGNGNPYFFRGLSVFFSLLILLIVLYIGREFSGSKGMIIAGLLLTGEWFFLKESRLSSLDLYCATFISAGILFFLQYLKKLNFRLLCLSGFIFGLGAMTKLFAIIPFGIIFLYLIISLRREPILRWKFPLIYLLSFLIPVLLIMSLFGFLTSFKGFFLNQLHRPSQPFSYKLKIFNYYSRWNFLMIIFALLGIRYGWKFKSVRVVALWLLSLTLFFFFQSTTWKHHLSLLSPPLAILAGAGAGNILSRKSGKVRKIFNALLFILIIITVMHHSFIIAKAIYFRKLPVIYKIAGKIKKLTSPEDFIISGDPLVTVLSNRRQPPGAINVAEVQYPPLTSDMLRDVCKKYKVKAIVLTHGLLKEKEDFSQLVKENYQLIAEYKDFELARIYHPPKEWKEKIYFLYIKKGEDSR